MSRRLSRRNALILGGAVAGGAGILGGIGYSASAESSPAAADWIRLPVITANVGRKNLSQRERAIRDVRKGDSDHRPFVGWQEIGEGKADKGEKGMIAEHFGDQYKTAFLGDKESFRVPISVPKPWKVTAQHKTWVHKGVKDRSPARWINEVVVQHSEHPELEFVLINTHYIANAFNGDQDKDLRPKWKKHKEKHAARILAHHKAGRPVIWTGDVNNADFKKATVWKAENRGFVNRYDRINWMPGGDKVQLDLVKTRKIPMHVDGHDAGVAIFKIRLA